MLNFIEQLKYYIFYLDGQVWNCYLYLLCTNFKQNNLFIFNILIS